MEEIERWLPIVGYEGSYEISDKGNVRSLDRVLANGRYIKGIPRKQSLDTKGYPQVGLRKYGKIKTLPIHRLVMRAFVGESDLYVDHIDANPLNNNLSNLRYCTQRMNLVYHHRRYKKHTGTYFDKRRNKYQATINVDGKHKHLGYFESESGAGAAYDKALRELESKV